MPPFSCLVDWVPGSLPLLLIHLAIRIHRHCGATLIDGMSEEVAKDLIIHPLADEILAAGHDDGVGTTGVVFHIDVRDEAACVAIGWLGGIDVHDGAVVVHFEQLPGAAVVISGPAAVENVREAEKAVRGRGGGAALPSLGVVTRAGKHHHAVHLLMHGKTRRRRAAVRDAAHDDFLPAQAVAVVGEELLPLALGIRFDEPFHELQRALHHAIGLRDIHQRAVIVARGGFEADIAQHSARAVLVLGFGDAREPAVRVMRLDAVIAVAGDALEQSLIVPHEPDHEFALRRHTGIYDGMLKVGGLPFVIGEGELDLRVLLRTRIDLTGSLREVKTLVLGSVEVRDEEEGEKKGFHADMEWIVSRRMIGIRLPPFYGLLTLC